MKRNSKKNRLSFARKLLVFAVGLFLYSPWSSPAAEITLDNAEMASRGRVSGGEFQISSVIFADLALREGYKYAFLLGFSFDAPDIAKAFSYRNLSIEPIAADPTAADYNVLAERVNNQAFLGFRVIKASARDLFGLPLEMSYFIGSGDDFCTGDEFGSRFGVTPFGTDFKGFFYFPDSVRYDGIYGVRGTGISLGLTKWEKVVPTLYLYKDFAFSNGSFGIAEENLYSGDLRLLFNYSRLRLETFAGLSLDADLDTSLRGGFMVHLAGNGVEFFGQAGIPGWTTGEKFSIDNLFFLLEPRLHFDLLSFFVTFFYHPAEYLHYPTNEQGMADLNIKVQFGNREAGLAGGFEVGGDFRNDSEEDYFVLRMAPYARIISGGIRWDAKLLIRPLDYETPAEMFEIFIGARMAR